MPLAAYSMSLDAVVVRDLVEDPTLTVLMKLTNAGVLYVKGQFIEQTRSIYVPPPIPPPTGSITFDDFNSYTAGSFLNGLNSGSNEWNNITSLTSYAADICFRTIANYDSFNFYATGSAINGLASGSRWDNSLSWTTEWFGAVYYISGTIAYDSFETYATNSLISGSGDQPNPLWQNFSGNWFGTSSWIGIQAYESFNSYSASAQLSGSNAISDTRYLGFTGPWIGRAQFRGIKAYDDFNSYSAGSSVSGLNWTSSIYPYWNGPWIIRTNVSGSI